MNEEKLIAWIRKSPQASGIGDDTAVFVPPAGKLLLQSDAFVEGVHFDRRTSGPQDWGRKAVMANVSDIAAMGGEPVAMLLNAGLPRSVSLAMAKKIYAGIHAAAKRYGIRILGGDTTRASEITLSVFMIGRLAGKKALLRSGAQAGDVVFVTGALGDSLATKHHLHFEPRVEEARYLARQYDAHAMMDVSDGLAKDAATLARESGVGMRIWESQVPLRTPKKGIESAFLDGEDFELLFCLGKKDAARLLKAQVSGKTKFKFFAIGEITAPRKLEWVDRHGKKHQFPKPQDHHFNGR